jgi:hypothetical protein
MDVFAQDICGIIYYLDNFNNVYKTEDILENKQDPQIIAKYTKENTKYLIKDFGL